jgi:hypothetical protein
MFKSTEQKVEMPNMSRCFLTKWSLIVQKASVAWDFFCYTFIGTCKHHAVVWYDINKAILPCPNQRLN